MTMLAPIFFSFSTFGSLDKILIFALFIIFVCAFGDCFDYFCAYFTKKLLNYSSKFQNFFNQPQTQNYIEIFKKYGSNFVMIAACIPVLHSTCSYIAGFLKYSFKKFILANTFANICIISLCFILGRFLGHFSFVKHHIYVIISSILIFCFGISAIITYVIKHKS